MQMNVVHALGNINQIPLSPVHKGMSHMSAHTSVRAAPALLAV